MTNAAKPIGAQEISAILGIEAGEMLTQLVSLAHRTLPAAPALAFDDLWFLLPWLDGQTTVEDLRAMGTPADVLPFATTGGDFGHYGFLMEGEIPTDERPIVFVMPNDEDETDIVAPNLRALLGLIASGPVDRISRAWTDGDWVEVASEFGGQRFLGSRWRLARRLCSLSGVQRPASPSAVTSSAPSRSFKTFPEVDAEIPALVAELVEDSRARDEARAKQPSSIARRIAIEISQALEEKRFVDAATAAENGLDNLFARPRCLAASARARWELGEPEQARRTLETLVQEWLEDAPAEPPHPHPRAQITKDELRELVRSLEHPDRAALLDRIERAGLVPEAKDFF